MGHVERRLEVHSRFRRRRRRNRHAALMAVGRCRSSNTDTSSVQPDFLPKKSKGRCFETWLDAEVDPPAEKGNAAAVRILGAGVKAPCRRLPCRPRRQGSRDVEHFSRPIGEAHEIAASNRVANRVSRASQVIACRAAFHFNNPLNHR